MRLGAIVLAGGESKRMGRPKASLEVGGETFLDRIVRTFGAVCEDVVVVTGAHELPVGAARRVENPDWRLGQLTSLQAGLRSIGTCDAAFFTPVDCPLFAAATVERLAQSIGEAPFAIPRMGERRGHPVLASAAVFPEFLALPPDARASDVVHRYVRRTVYVDVDDPGIFADIDTPEDYARLVKA